MLMKINLIIRRLRKLYSDEEWHSGDPFQVLISTVLSQRTRDEVTEKASKRLFQHYSTPEALAEADPRVVMELIREVGFYKVKASRIKEIARIIRDRCNGKVPKSMEALLELPGVGRKTANCVLTYGFKLDAIAVDTHVHRISNRLGLVCTKTPEQTEKELRKTIPKKYWQNINELFVRFGQDLCRPIGPKCETCPLNDLCPHAKNLNQIISEN